ncbi:hypothetical protein KUTeg_006717, partial [Tegillarca granosa]
MKFDDILIHLGEFGYYQIRLYLLLCIPAITTGCYMMGLVFYMAPPEHRCKLPMYPNDTYNIQSSYHGDLINTTIPLSSSDLHTYDQCHLYSNHDNTSGRERSLIECDQWVYDRTTFYETFTSKENLVCEDTMKTSHAQMIFYFGVLVGDLGFGMFIGRKKTFAITAVILFLSGLGTAWAPEYYSFVLLQFIDGAAVHGIFMICCVLGVELVGPTKRVWAGIPIHIFFAIGLVYLAGSAYLFRNWFYVQLTVAIPLCFTSLIGDIFINRRFIPESPRWLISQGRFEEAEKILYKVAQVNKKVLPERIVDEKTIDENAKDERLWHLFTSQFPANTATIFLLDRMGRKKLHCLCMFVSGFACLGTIFPVLFGGDELRPLTLTLAVIGKFGAAAAFGVVYQFSLELYPTVVRNGGMGASSCVARFGGMAAPYVAKLGDLVTGKFGQALPLVIFGACSVSAGLLALALPETLGRKLPDTIKEAETFSKRDDKGLEYKINKPKLPSFNFISDKGTMNPAFIGENSR